MNLVLAIFFSVLPQNHQEAIIYDFYFGVLQPVACTLSRLLEEPSLATTI
jgi:hypothetical protein